MMGDAVKSRVGANALENLVREGWFTQREDGWCYASKPPNAADLDYFVSLLRTVAAYTVGDNATIQVTRGGSTSFGLMWKVKD